MPGESRLSHPRSPSYTARTQQAAYPDTGAYDLSREERPEDPPLQRAMLPIRLAYAPAVSAAGTVRCELRWRCWRVPHVEVQGSHNEDNAQPTSSDLRDPSSWLVAHYSRCASDRNEVRHPHRFLGERAAKVAYDSAELEGRSRGIGLRGARCVTVMFLGWHVNSCVYLYIP